MSCRLGEVIQERYFIVVNAAKVSTCMRVSAVKMSSCNVTDFSSDKMSVLSHDYYHVYWNKMHAN